MLDFVVHPFIPFSAEKIRSMLGISPLSWNDLTGKILVMPGSKVGEAKLLFEKIEDHEVESQKAKLKKTS